MDGRSAGLSEEGEVDMGLIIDLFAGGGVGEASGRCGA